MSTVLFPAGPIRLKQIFREVGVKKPVSPDAAEAVYKQWQDIRVQAEVAKEQDRQQKEREAQIESLSEEREHKVQMQRELLSAAGAKTDAEFRGKLLKFRQFQQYKEVYDQTEAHIRLIAKNPKKLSELRHELKIHTLKNWTDERDYYQKKIADAEKKLAEVAEKTRQHHRTPESDGQERRIRKTTPEHSRTARPIWTATSMTG